MINLARRFLSSVAVTFFVLSGSSIFANSTDSSTRAELPQNGRVRVINRLGDVSIQIWDGNSVLIEAVTKGNYGKTNPVAIQRSPDQLLITATSPVVREKQPPRVDLRLKVPASAKVGVITAAGEVSISGFPRELNVLTRSGHITASVSGKADADIRALSLKGNAETTVGEPSFGISVPSQAGTPSEARVFHVKLGSGSSVVELRSTTGDITLAASSESATNSSPSPAEQPRIETLSRARETKERRPPTLDENTGSSQPAGTPAPARSEQDVDEGDVVRVDTRLVTMNVSVVERDTNRGVQNLAKSDFNVIENGTKQQIVSFNSANEPFNLLLLIDLSGSTKEVVALIRQAALRFVNAARPSDRIAIITFANAPVIVSPLTEDRGMLRDRINAIQEPKGSTKLYDSVKFALDEVVKEGGGTRRNAVVLMSDGLDSQLPNVSGEGSSINYKDLVSEISEFDGVLYSLWLDTEYEALSPEDVQPETVDLAHDRMKEMSDAGGGVFYEVEKLQDLAGVYEQVVADLGTVYSIGYRPQDNTRDGKWRTIRIDIDKPNTVARGKRGYYAR